MQLAIAHRASISNDIEILRSDGTVAYVQNDVEPLYDTRGEVYGCVSVCVDLTEQKLAQTGADRGRPAQGRVPGHAVPRTAQSAGAACAAPSRSCAWPGTSPTSSRKRAQTMERQLMQLVRLTDDLLDVARITQGKLEMRRERIDLRAVLHAAVEAARPAIEGQGHALNWICLTCRSGPTRTRRGSCRCSATC